MSAIFLLFITLSVQSQTTGDYRSAATGNWSTVATWERFNGTSWVAAPASPSSADGVISIRSPHTISVIDARTADQLIVDAGGTLTITSTLTVNDGAGTDMTVNGTLNTSSILDGSGSVLVNGTMNWTANDVAVNLTIASGATLNMGITNIRLLSSKTILNQGTINRTGGDLLLLNGTLQNENIINQSVSSSILNLGGTNLFTNTSTGVFTQSVATGVSNFSIPTINAGVININSGTLSFGSTTTHTGIINAASGTTFQNSDNFTDNGTINIVSATFNNIGTFTQNDLVSFTGTVTANNTGTWNINVAQVFSSTATLNNSSNLGGSGSVLINGTMNWTINDVAVNLTIASGATLNMGINNIRLLGEWDNAPTEAHVGDKFENEEGSYTASFTGFTTVPTATWKYVKTGRSVTLTAIGQTGTSNATTKTITGMPANIWPAQTVGGVVVASDNGTAFVMVQWTISTAGVVTVFSNLNSGAWTASGTANIQTNWFSYNLF